jgi:hypothetical protein
MAFKLISIRLFFANSLIFFGIFLSLSCTKEPQDEISILWEDERALGLILPSGLVENPEQAYFTIHLSGNSDNPPILGDLIQSESGFLFTPLIPLTRGQTYEVRYEGASIGQISIPQLSEEGAKLEVMEIYPTQNLLPENLLKFFVKFSKPMREGKSSTNVFLLDSNKDTLEGAFLDLQPELWNEDQTLLTLWLDPGRIKRDLIPNLEMGAPLTKGESYNLVISARWKGKNGGELGQSFSKKFTASARDSISPEPDSWVMDIPKADTNAALTLDFLEALDFSLLADVFTIKNAAGRAIQGNWEIGIEEKSIQFIPKDPWSRGLYVIEIESRLEDLAGNNLNRLFETDLLNRSESDLPSDIKRLEFEIKD